MTKFFVTTIAVLNALCGNAMAQDNTPLPEPSADANASQGTQAQDGANGAPAGSPAEFDRNATYQACINEHDGDVSGCCNDYTNCEEQLDNNQQLMIDMATANHQTPEQLSRYLCRQHGGTWHGVQSGDYDWRNDAVCSCEGHGRSWQGNERFCVNPSSADYLKDRCEENHGTWTGAVCNCPPGTTLEQGYCEGDVVTRAQLEQQVGERQQRIAALEQQLAALQHDLNTANTNSASQADRITNLESQLAAEQSQLELLRSLLAQRVAEATPGTAGNPPIAPPALPPSLRPQPDAAAAGGTNPIAPTSPPPEDGEESCWGWSGACTWGLVGSLLAAGGIVVGGVCGAGYCTSHETRVNWGRNE